VLRTLLFGNGGEVSVLFALFIKVKSVLVEEPDELRGSRPVLGGAEGEIPSAYSTEES